MGINDVATFFYGRDIDFSKEKKRLSHDLKPMSLQDNEQINNFKSQHERGSCNQESVADKRNGVATCF